MIKERNMLVEAALGALAGGAAAWMMGKATSYLYDQENQQAREREDAARDGKMAYGVAAEKAAELMDQELDDDQRQQYGSAIHWALSLAAGAAYGVMRDAVPLSGWSKGLLFGAAFWLTVDEAGNAALGLTKPPQAFPWQTHARGLAGHLVFGVVTEACFQLFDAHQ
ncbi:DUF1440 domain-containing protein [Deinococcus peraridilitoris]|uniref:Putative periplasmic/secreted protein n=1 Tax=Deinococcus peraridilitoris (strain DSM 19664 / LMG 22246 / CIP 109416 / KR-200) TaxID=937777 RepID=K9ZXF0_DEIPD|nr:DUF1440 domain-containing protein [Deinococcus peraridilitoris]AFZ66251.1 putative periplasmic/secreted protein [Deinococcus peraridilitoris DSM 19664]